MKNILMVLDPGLTPSMPAIQALASALHDPCPAYLDQTPGFPPEVSRVVVCATPDGAHLIQAWLKEIRNILSQLEWVAFVEIAEADSPDSWLLDEQGWLELPNSPLLAARIAASDISSAIDFALALLHSSRQNPLPTTPVERRKRGKGSNTTIHGDES